MQKVETGKPPMSWNQYQAQLAAGKMEAIAPKKAAKQ
jgi:hypothetical protein